VPLEIRSERADDASDVAAIQALQRAAFPSPDEARLIDRLRASGAYDPALSLLAQLRRDSFASDAPSIVGHCLMTQATLVRPDGSTETGRILALGPLAVLPSFQRRGVGAALMRAAVQRADAAGFAAIVLLGHPTYYPRFGFRPARAQGLLPPVDWRDAAWQALRLSGSTPEDTGTVHYAPPFLSMGDPGGSH
jgi:putative acetyltransferase